MCIDRRRQSGVTLVELIVFIVIVGVGVAGVLSTIGPSLKYSAEPQVRKQMTAIAESLLLEILHQPFTLCDPDDPNASTAASTAGCTGGAANSQDKGGGALTTPSPATETRYANAPGAQFDNVSDYGGFNRNDIDDATGNNTMAGYNASVAVSRAGAAFGLADDADALQITVTVTHNAETFSLTGYRFRYAPRY